MTLQGWLARCPLVAILRGVRPEEVVEIAAALEAAGLSIVEVPLNSPEPVESIRRLVQHFGERLLIGAGTVMTTDQVDELAAFGARLVVTPHAAVAVVQRAKHHGMIACPGFATPTEAFASLEAGADGIKLFPAEAASPAALKAIRSVLPPGTPVLPVGGIGPDNMRPWLDAGAAGFGIGGSIYRPGDSAQTVAGKAARLIEGWRVAAGSTAAASP